MCFGLALFVWRREQGRVVRPLLGVALSLLGAQKLLAIWLVSNPSALQVRLPWLAASALLPGLWLAVSLTYGRAEPAAFLRRWNLALLAAFAVPLGAAWLPLGDFFDGLPVLAGTRRRRTSAMSRAAPCSPAGSGCWGPGATFSTSP